MRKQMRRHNGGFQVEGSEIIHQSIGSAARAAGLPSNTYWDYEREQAMVPAKKCSVLPVALLAMVITYAVTSLFGFLPPPQDVIAWIQKQDAAVKAKREEIRGEKGR